jgi:hypothetical protein
VALKAKVSTIKQMEQHLEDLKGENHRQDERIHELEALLADTIEVRRIADDMGLPTSTPELASPFRPPSPVVRAASQTQHARRICVRPRVFVCLWPGGTAQRDTCETP